MNTLEEEVKQLQEAVDAKMAEFKWDVPLDCKVEYFDPLLSYEATGYRPINSTKGLDFDPSWFTEARRVYEETGAYCTHLPGSKKFREFWTEQSKRCLYGYTSHGYTLTGDHYFFLNFYRLPLITEVKVSGQGRPEGFPNFTVAQYEWFHYFQYAKVMKMNAALMKARGIG